MGIQMHTADVRNRNLRNVWWSRKAWNRDRLMEGSRCKARKDDFLLEYSLLLQYKN